MRGAVATWLLVLGCAAPRPLFEPMRAAPCGQLEPKDPAFQWICLTSGEWLKGTVHRMRDEVLHFDSDELGDLEIDWGDVAQVWSQRQDVFVLDDNQQITGRAAVTPRQLVVEGEAGRTIHSRDRLVAIVPGTTSELDFWELEATVGATFNWGNVDQTSMSARSEVVREDGSTRLLLSYNGDLTRANSQDLQNRHVAIQRFDIYVGRDLYIRPLGMTFEHDRLANIQLRFVPGAVVGYDITRRPHLEWDVEAGAGYQYLRNLSVQAGEQQARHDAGAQIATRVEIDITSDLELELAWSSLLVFTNVRETRHHAVVEISIDLGDPFEVALVLDYIRQENPIADANGVVPNKDDLQLIVGLSLDPE